MHAKILIFHFPFSLQHKKVNGEIHCFPSLILIFMCNYPHPPILFLSCPLFNSLSTQGALRALGFFFNSPQKHHNVPEFRITLARTMSSSRHMAIPCPQPLCPHCPLTFCANIMLVRQKIGCSILPKPHVLLNTKIFDLVFFSCNLAFTLILLGMSIEIVIFTVS